MFQHQEPVADADGQRAATVAFADHDTHHRDPEGSEGGEVGSKCPALATFLVPETR